MSFVPVTGPARFLAADAPRDGVVEFTDDRRTVTMPIRGALPLLTRAPSREESHPSVRLIAGAALLGMRLVAAGSFEPAAGRWQPTRLTAEDEDRLARLADGDEETERVVREVVAAVVDAMPRSAPDASRAFTRPVARRPFRDRLAQRLQAHDTSHLAQLVRISLRIEADEEELRAGAVRVVLQVHDEQEPLRVCDAALLWTGEAVEHGFGDRARTHASIALRAAVEAWPVLDRLLELRVPDEITLDTDELVSLLDEGVAALAARGIDVMWPRSLGRDLTATAVLDRRPGSEGPREAPLQTGVLNEEALFGFSWQLALHGDPLTPEEMDELARAASPVLRLRGQWAVVDPGLARKARKRLIRSATPAQAVAAALSGVAEVEDGPHEGASEVIVGASLLRVREQLETAATRPPLDPPAGLAASLRDYQLHGLTWLDQLTSLGLGACLADDMGLGKTITLIALALHRAERPEGSGPTLVVCPASLLGNWEAEVHRFAPGLTVRRFHGSARDLADLSGPGFVLTTYGTMRVDHEALATVAWDLVVADEAQHVKNARSATARALRKIPSAARVALTGTPVENELAELWAILDWATPGLLGSRNAFRRVWAAPIEAGVDPAVTARFRDLVSPFLLRRRKSDPGIAPELPPRTDTDHLLSLTREQVVLYEAFVRDSLDRIERADPRDTVTRAGLVLAMLTGLKQICNHPSHFLKQGVLRHASDKTDLLDEIVGTVLAEGGAVLVFTQYVAMARLLEGHLEKLGVPHQLLHGGTPVRERERMVRSFQSGEVPVFLLSLKAGGTGLNLTRADHVVHFDRWWNPAVEEQASDRAHRIGQTRPVQVHRMITTGTIEEKIAELLARKQSLADSVLVGGEQALTELSNAELRDLVELRGVD
ncbi:DEAD/DEAH box helicase [Nocardioides euryhalodurans]|uniref:DEAD/DEAH box helicase n=1 Tax=Nocardioides euryhalodurans TaxID=2518370 RepID=A0A4V1BDZ1_9ACTN|nr:DEAD/DEAH box helicase [Nocardioides euryhalodurans]QBR92802.1 DEAD/DEAH box helicase [Nocardioides euryhalodurans]